MNFYCFDTGALAQRCVRIVETAAALADVARTGRIALQDRDIACRPFVHDAVHPYQFVPVRTDDLHTAAHLTQRHPLRAYDAVQLSVALRHHRALARREHQLVFVSGDGRQLEAARAEGLTVDNPFDHASPPDRPAE